MRRTATSAAMGHCSVRLPALVWVSARECSFARGAAARARPIRGLPGLRSAPNPPCFTGQMARIHAMHDDLMRDVLGTVVAAAHLEDLDPPMRDIPAVRSLPDGDLEIGAATSVDWARVADAGIDSAAIDQHTLGEGLAAVNAELPPAWGTASWPPDGRPGAVRAVLAGLVTGALDGLAAVDALDPRVLDERADDAVQEFFAFIRADRLKVVRCAPLTVVRPAGDVCRLDDMVSLVALDADGRRAVWRALGRLPPVGYWASPSIHDLKATHSVVEVKGVIAHGEAIRWQDIQHPIELIVDAVRLVVPGAVHILGSYTRFPAFGEILRRLLFTGTIRHDSGARGPIEGQAVIDAPDFLVDTWERLKVRASYLTAREQASLDRALQRVRYAYDRGGDEDRLIDCWIAFEALFLHDASGELRYRAALRIARAVGATHDERTEIFLRLRKLYDARSKVAHGAELSTTKTESVGTLADETLGLLRRAIVWWLDPKNPREGRAMDEALLA